MIITTADAPAAIGPYVQGVNLGALLRGSGQVTERRWRRNRSDRFRPLTPRLEVEPPAPYPPIFDVPRCSYYRHYSH